MARTWLQVRVDLLEGLAVPLDPAPGRIFIVGPGHTFAQLAVAIDAAFARWDLSHLHVFELADGRRIGYPDDDLALGTPWLDHGALKVAREVRPGESFTYVFDLGDDWRHRCSVLPEKIDPFDELGPAPRHPVAIWGWGTIPDQYGRTSFEDADEDD